MLDGTVTADAAAPDEATGGARKGTTREMSTIQFPYADLEAAVEMTRMMRDRGGNTPFSKDQLAAILGHAVSSGAFSAKIHAARMFGLIEVVAGKYRVTQLGFETVDPDLDRVKAAKVEAFLRVPLYRRAYEEHRGKTLPSRPHGLERVFVEYGVTTTRAHNARWAFERSARYAGYFDHGEERLVAPLMIIAAAEGERADDSATATPRAEQTTRTESSKPPSRHHLIEGLFEALPTAKAKWSVAERSRWLRLAASMFDVLYTTDDRDVFIIEVKTVKEPTDGKTS